MKMKLLECQINLTSQSRTPFSRERSRKGAGSTRVYSRARGIQAGIADDYSTLVSYLQIRISAAISDVHSQKRCVGVLISTTHSPGQQPTEDHGRALHKL